MGKAHSKFTLRRMKGLLVGPNKKKKAQRVNPQLINKGGVFGLFLGSETLILIFSLYKSDPEAVFTSQRLKKTIFLQNQIYERRSYSLLKFLSFSIFHLPLEMLLIHRPCVIGYLALFDDRGVHFSQER